MTVIGMRRAIASRFPVEAAEADDFLAQCVENLMSGLKADARRWAWPMIPPNLKKLFIDFWGEPDV